MEHETRPIIVESVDGSYKAEFTSIKVASRELYNGVQSGYNCLQSLVSGRTKTAKCPKIGKIIKAKYKY